MVQLLPFDQLFNLFHVTVFPHTLHRTWDDPSWFNLEKNAQDRIMDIKCNIEEAFI